MILKQRIYHFWIVNAMFKYFRTVDAKIMPRCGRHLEIQYGHH
jgi:hypothetical protein